jgi:hypothetical protein
MVVVGFTGETPFRTGWLLSALDRIGVDDDVICIIGCKSTLEDAIAGQAVAPERSSQIRAGIGAPLERQ